MTYEPYWCSIELSSRDEKVFARLRVEKFDAQPYYEAVIAEILSSPDSSISLKRKAVLYMSMLDEARLWGLSNLFGQDLYEIIQTVFNYHRYYLSMKDLETLASNPAFISSRGKDFDCILLIFSLMDLYHTGGPQLRDDLILALISEGTMNFATAELIIDVNSKRDSFVQIDEAPVLEWARKSYTLEETPDSWVRKFLGAS